jgi:hypothetical protein
LLIILRKIFLFLFPNFDPFFSIEKVKRSIIESLHDQNISNSIINTIPLRKISIEIYKYKTNFPIYFRSEMYFSDKNIFELKNVLVNINSGACYTKDFYFLESYGSLRSWLLGRPIKYLNYKYLDIPDQITCLKITGYAHFLLEELPRFIWILEYYPNIILVLPLNPPNYVKQFIDILKSNNTLKNNPIFIKYPNIFVAKYVFTQSDMYSGFWHNSDIIKLKKVFLNTPLIKQNKYIYISRRNSTRSIYNEESFEKFLKNISFDIIFLEEISVSEKILIFQSSKIIIAPHGGGLSNIVWCNLNCKIIEIFSDDFFNDCYARLSSSLNLDYDYIFYNNDYNKLKLFIKSKT